MRALFAFPTVQVRGTASGMSMIPIMLGPVSVLVRQNYLHCQLLMCTKQIAPLLASCHIALLGTMGSLAFNLLLTRCCTHWLCAHCLNCVSWLICPQIVCIHSWLQANLASAEKRFSLFSAMHPVTIMSHSTLPGSEPSTGWWLVSGIWLAKRLLCPSSIVLLEWAGPTLVDAA